MHRLKCLSRQKAVHRFTASVSNSKKIATSVLSRYMEGRDRFSPASFGMAPLLIQSFLLWARTILRC